jgi:hypothetical protein
MLLCVALDDNCDNEQKTIRMLCGFTITALGLKKLKAMMLPVKKPP